MLLSTHQSSAPRLLVVIIIIIIATTRETAMSSITLPIRRLWGHLLAFETRGSLGRIVSALHPVRSRTPQQCAKLQEEHRECVCETFLLTTDSAAPAQQHTSEPPSCTFPRRRFQMMTAPRGHMFLAEEPRWQFAHSVRVPSTLQYSGMSSATVREGRVIYDKS